jgi:hypothetical protein
MAQNKERRMCPVHPMPMAGEQRSTKRRADGAQAAPRLLWRPEEHLISILVQNPQTVWALRHLQVQKEGFGFYHRVLQISRDMRSPSQRRMGLVSFTNPEELDRKLPGAGIGRAID